MALDTQKTLIRSLYEHDHFKGLLYFIKNLKGRGGNPCMGSGQGNKILDVSVI